MPTTYTALQQSALDLVAREGGLDLAGHAFDPETATFAVSRDGEVLDFAGPEALETIAAYNFSASVEEYLAEAADLYEAGLLDIRIVTGGLAALA